MTAVGGAAETEEEEGERLSEEVVVTYESPDFCCCCCCLRRCWCSPAAATGRFQPDSTTSRGGSVQDVAVLSRSWRCRSATNCSCAWRTLAIEAADDEAAEAEEREEGALEAELEWVTGGALAAAKARRCAARRCCCAKRK